MSLLGLGPDILAHVALSSPDPMWMLFGSLCTLTLSAWTVVPRSASGVCGLRGASREVASQVRTRACLYTAGPAVGSESRATDAFFANNRYIFGLGTTFVLKLKTECRVCPRTSSTTVLWIMRTATPNIQ